uniref:Uncharacterized protein n=1 Tax=Anopheles coluzzii TaxID=1518534 RepID=A0A8W7Q203_ANOCL
MIGNGELGEGSGEGSGEAELPSSESSARSPSIESSMRPSILIYIGVLMKVIHCHTIDVHGRFRISYYMFIRSTILWLACLLLIVSRNRRRRRFLGQLILNRISAIPVGTSDW